MATGEREHVVVAGSLAYVAYVLPPVLSSFQLRHPELRLSVQEMSSRETLERVRVGRADLGVLVSGVIPKDLAESLVVGNLFTDELVVMESTEHPFSSGQMLTLAEVSRFPFVGLVRGEQLGEVLLNRALVAAGLEAIRPVMEFSAWAGTLSAVRSGVGMAVVFRSVARRELARGELRTVPVEGYHSAPGVVLICSPQRRHGRVSAVFEGLIRHLVREVPVEVGESAPHRSGSHPRG
jgi:DNA-binding transcriptional LysR family regulator